MYRRYGLFAIMGVVGLLLPSCDLRADIARAVAGYSSTSPPPIPSTPIVTPTAPSPVPSSEPSPAPSPVPSPATPPAGGQGELKGWQLNESNVGLARVGLSCDQLPRYAGGEKVPAGATIREKRIETTLDLSAGNITVERSCIRPKAVERGQALITTTDFNRCDANSCPPPATATVRDCEIDGSLIDNASVAYSLGFGGIGSVERCYIHDVGNGIGVYGAGTQADALVVGNYITRLRAWGDPSTTGSHNDGLTIRSFPTPGKQATIKNNRIIASSGNDTGALFIQPNGASIDNVLVEGNLLEGNGYQLGLEAKDFVFGRSMRAVDNRFSGTSFGPSYVERKGLNYGWTEWRDNYINDPTKSDNRGRPVPAP